MREKITVKSFAMKLKSMDADYGITHQEKSSSNGFLIDAVALKATLTKDFNIKAEECLLDLAK